MTNEQIERAAQALAADIGITLEKARILARLLAAK